MGKTKMPLGLAREKAGRLSEMLGTLVGEIHALEEKGKRLEAEATELLGSADVDALQKVARLSEQGEKVAADRTRKQVTRSGIEASILACEASVVLLEREESKELLDAQGPELIETRRTLFEKFRAFAVGFARDVGAIEKPHHEHQDLREKIFGSPEGRATRELSALQAAAARLTHETRGMPQ